MTKKSAGRTGRSKSDQKRIAFLKQLEAPCLNRSAQCVFQYVPVSPLPCLCLAISVPGHKGRFLVVPFALNQNTKIYGDPFPDGGVPHLEVYLDDGQELRSGHVLSCRIEKVVEAFVAWLALDQAVPRLRGAPTSRDWLSSIAAQLPNLAKVSVVIDPAAVDPLPASNQEQFERDLDQLAINRIATFFPRGESGRLLPRARVLLSAYGPELSRGKQRWLHVGSSASRNAPTLTVSIEPLFERHTAHNWQHNRWRWDRQTAAPPGWGIPQPRLTKEKQRLNRCLAALDRGHFDRALDLYGISWSDEVAAVLAGQPLNLAHAELAPTWTRVLNDALAALAPWELVPAAGQKSQRLMTLPGQRQIRKASLMLVLAEGAPRLTIEWTGTNTRLPGDQWRRDPVADIARLGLAKMDLPSESAVRQPRCQPPGVDIVALAEKFRQKVTSDMASAYSAALNVAKRLPRDTTAGVLREIFVADEVALRRRALEIACALRIESLSEPAMPLLNDADQVVRSRAADFIQRVKYEPGLCIIAARTVADKSNFYVGAHAIRGWGDKAGVPSIRALLKSTDENVRAAACLTPVMYGGKKLVDELVSIAATDTPLVAGAALHALASLDPEAHKATQQQVEQRADADAVRQNRNKFKPYERI